MFGLVSFKLWEGLARLYDTKCVHSDSYVKTVTIPPFQGSDAGINRSEEDCTGSGTPGELSLLQSMEQSHLQDKLVDLQNKKQHMDQLLTELQALRSDKYAQIQNNRHIGE